MEVELKYINRANLSGGSIRPDGYHFLVHFIKANKWSSVLEVGPGASTWAFLENNCQIDSIEHDPQWLQKHGIDLREFLGNCQQHVQTGEYRFTGQVRLFPFKNEDTIIVPPLMSSYYDFAFVDGPPGKPTLSRWNAMQFALERANVVAIHDCNRVGEKETLERVREMGWQVRTLGNICCGFGLCFKKEIVIPVKQ